VFIGSMFTEAGVENGRHPLSPLDRVIEPG
jgi:hypothetical protein